MLNRFRLSLMVSLLGSALLAGCGVAPTATMTERNAPTAKAAKASSVRRTVEPVLDRTKLALEVEDGHHVHLQGQPGAVKGQGVWVSEGVHAKPAAGFEFAAGADGSLSAEVHAHPGEELTVWAFVDQGETRAYSQPVVFKVPAK